MTEEINQEISDELKVYEVGFHLVPSISEEQVAVELADIKKSIEKNGGIFLSEEAPKLHPLAYEIAKKVGGVNRKFTQAYFGFIKFEAAGETVVNIKTDLDKKDSIIRFIMIKTIKDNTLYGLRVARSEGSGKAIRKPTKEEAGKGAVSPVAEAEIDKEIENLVIE